MPLVAGEHQGASLPKAQRLDLLHRLVEDLLLHHLPLPVQSAQLAGQLLRLGAVAGEEEVRGQLRLPHPPGGIEPGGEDEADLNGGDLLVIEPCLPEKGL